MNFLSQLFQKNKSLKADICGLTLVLLSTISFPSLAQLPRFDAPLPDSSSQKKPSPIISPSTSIESKPAPKPIVIDSTAPLPGERQSSIGIIKPVNGVVNIKLTNKTAATISYEVIGDTSQRKLPRKSEVVLRKLKLPVNITFHREQGGFLLIKHQLISDKSILELTMTETNDFNLDRSSLLIEETGSVFLN